MEEYYCMQHKWYDVEKEVETRALGCQHLEY